KLGQDPSLVGNAGSQNVVERGDAVGGDNQQAVVHAIHVADLAARVARHAVEIRFQNYGMLDADGVFDDVHSAFKVQSGEYSKMITFIARLSINESEYS